MTFKQGELKLLSSDGYQTSVAEVNIVEEFFPVEYTRKNFLMVTIDVKAKAKVRINGSTVTIEPELGLFYNSEHEPMYELTFLESGIDYYFFASH